MVKIRSMAVCFTLLVIAACVVFPRPVEATDVYAQKTGKGCIFCHQESTGGMLQPVGFAYIRNGYAYPISERILKKSESIQSPFHKSLRFIVGYLHLLAAVIFFGAIFYIHIFIRPTRLKGGIPKAERILGLSCMAVLTITGTYLTWMRIDKWEQFFNNTFGLMLLIKILLFLIMVSIGITAVTVIHRKMKREVRSTETGPPAAGIRLKELAGFDGASGRLAYIAYRNRIYDVTASTRWKDGRHFGKHQAGSDLTSALDGAPHGVEVFEKVSLVGELLKDEKNDASIGKSHKVFVVLAYTNLVIIFLILACISVWRWDFPLRLIPEKRAEILAGKACIECHRIKTPGIYRDWSESVHARVGVDCDKCHRANSDAAVLKSHLQHDKKTISAVVSPTSCRGCHPKEADQYAKSKHANTQEIIWKIDFWLRHGMNNRIERASGCYACHGTVVEVIEGHPVAGTWPNVGVGRINPDGSKGSCSSCHTRHRFSIVEARKPEACDQCHLGPDHPQIEIYNESKHGTIYHAEGDRWDWDPDNKLWQAGKDFRAPTCAACHMSAAFEVPKTHDVTERLSWETQAPLTVRPRDFKPFPSATDWKTEREKMKKVCRQCHSQTWTDAHFRNFDDVVTNYNEIYYTPVKALMDDLYAKGLLDETKFFDEKIEFEFYELWHHEGRRARMGAAMMAPDYSWWHGFYECKKRYNSFMQEARDLIEHNKKAYMAPDFPNATGVTERSKELFHQ